VCGNNNGAQFGLQWTIDVCVAATCDDGVQNGGETAIDFGGSCGTSCGGANGDEEGFCTPGCPCAVGEGDCDLDAECAPGLLCVADKGGDYGLSPIDDVCLPPMLITDTLAGDLVVTEIMSNPDKVLDSRGEYFEIYNATAYPIELQGLYVRDGGATQHFTVGTSLVIHPKKYMTFAKNGNAALNGGITEDYDYSDIFVLLATDVVWLQDGTGFTIDKVSYNLTWPQPVGRSIELDKLTTDATSNNTAANWCQAAWALADGDKGSPGIQNHICPP
jgi:hypothetical protein